MARKQSEIIKSNELDVALLKEIYEHELSLKEIATKVKEIKDRQKNLIWQAQQKKITCAGNYELVSKARITRTIDMAALWSWAPKDLVMKIAKVALKDAERVFSKEQVEKVTIKTPSTTYKVIKHDL